MTAKFVARFVRYTCAAVAQEWVKKFVEVPPLKRSASDEPKTLPVLPKDSYFGTPAEELYPVKEAHDG